jgi:hypothetical protein
MKMTAAFFVADGERLGGAMAGKRDTSLPGTIQRKENTGRENEARRTHLG